MARCDRQQDEQTALVLDTIPGAVLTARDNVYGGGALSDYQHCYGPSWDRHVARTRPAVGDEGYRTTGAAGYFSCFGAAAGDPGRGYCKLRLGHVAHRRALQQHQHGGRFRTGNVAAGRCRGH